jgi:hypothetical protein
MAVSGNLRTMPFFDLMQWISLARKTGTLVIKGQRFTKKILFHGGTVAAVTSNNPREHLGYYLVGWDYVSEDELQDLLEMQKQFNQMLGELLVKTGRLDREQVDYLVRVKTEETIFDVMLWEEGEFFFLDDAQPRRDFKELDLPVEHFVFEGARQADERRRMSELIPHVGHVPRVVQALDDSQLSEVGLAIVAEIDGERSIEEIALRCRLPEFPVLSFVYDGVVNGVFEILAPPEQPHAIPGFVRTTWRDLTREAETGIAMGDLLEAYRQLVALRQKYAGIADAEKAADAVERDIVKEMEQIPMSPTMILELALAPADIVNLKCAPEEGFVLSRINGIYTLPQILTMLPGPKLYNQLIIHNLLQRGIIKLRESQAVVRFSGQRSLTP